MALLVRSSNRVSPSASQSRSVAGSISLAVGAALAHDGPAYLLIGDLTFLHDAGGLHLGLREPVPELTVVLADDVGGGIFTVLEQGAAERRTQLFGDLDDQAYAATHAALADVAARLQALVAEEGA